MLEVLSKGSWIPESLDHKLQRYNPRTDLGRIVKQILTWGLTPDMGHELLDAITRCVIWESRLDLVVRRLSGEYEMYGTVSQKVVTDAGAGFIVDAWQNLVELENMKYHGVGTGSTAEATGQTALVTELTTEYSVNNTRPTGTTAEASAMVFQSVATVTVDSAVALREHGLFSQAATGGGTMFDRSVFSAVNLSALESAIPTYSIAVSPGG